VEKQVKLPPGYTVTWSGQYEYMERAAARLRIIVPATLLAIFLLLYMNFRNLIGPLVVMLSIPFALIGGIWMVYAYDFNLSVAMVVGFIALAGVAAEIGVLVLTFVDESLRRSRHERALTEGISIEAVRLSTDEISAAVFSGTAERVRPVAMTAVAIIVGLLPVMLGSGTSSEVMRRIAAPMVGGMLSTTVLCLLVLPVVYGWILQRRED